MPFSCRLLPLRVPDELPKSMGSVHKHPIVVSQPYCFQGSLLFVIHLFRHCVPEWPAVKIVLQRSGGAVVIAWGRTSYMYAVVRDTRRGNALL